MNKIKVGDFVRRKEGKSLDLDKYPNNRFKVTCVNPVADLIKVSYNNTVCEEFYALSNFELITLTNKPAKANKTFMSTLKQIPATLKRVIDKDLQAQYKAGFIDESLALTEKGSKALIQALALSDMGKTLLTTEANIVIEEAEKDKK